MIEATKSDGAKIKTSEVSDPIGLGTVEIQCNKLEFSDGKLSIIIDKEHPLASIKTLVILVGEETLTLTAPRK